jgi:ribosomal protein L19E
MRIEDIKRDVDREIRVQHEKAAAATEKAEAIQAAWSRMDVDALIDIGAICSLHRDWLEDYWLREQQHAPGREEQ